MERENRILRKVIVIISGKVSIFIYLFLFFYLVIFAIACYFIPPLEKFAPSEIIQLILGNYTNVLSALGASIAAGSGVFIHHKVKTLHEHNQKLQNSIDELNKKMDKIIGKEGS